MFKRLSLAVAMSTVAAVPAFAHLDPLEHGSIVAGLSHPLFGADHILAMVAVGLWAAQIATDPNRRQALWLVPAAFVAMMVLGFGLAVADAPLPFVEPAVLASVMGLGLLVALAARVPVAAAAAVVGIFALFHGYAHGGELGSAAALQFGLGFAVATAFLHLVGVGLGMATARLAPAIGRIAGAATALAGLSLAFGG